MSRGAEERRTLWGLGVTVAVIRVSVRLGVGRRLSSGKQ